MVRGGSAKCPRHDPVYQNFVSLLYDSEKDTLTGLHNRRKLEAKLKDYSSSRPQGQRKKGENHGDYLAIMDLDRFKRINDNFGHLIGDEVLLTTANILRRALRDSDFIFRYGGEEFIALLHESRNNSIEEILGRIRRNIENHDYPLAGTVTISIGYARLDGTSSPLDTIGQADRALDFAKGHDRNRAATTNNWSNRNCSRKCPTKAALNSSEQAAGLPSPHPLAGIAEQT